MEDRRPVNKLAQRCQRKIVQHAHAHKFGLGQVLRTPLNRSPSLASGLKRNPLLARSRVCLPQRLVVSTMLFHERGLAVLAQQAGRHRHRAACIQHVNHGLTVMRRNLHGRVSAACRRPADQQRQLEPLPLHLLGHMHHLVERRRNQPAQPDHVRLLRLGALEDLLARDHHSHVDHLVVVACQHHAHNILANVVNVSLHRRQHDLSLRLHFLAGSDHRLLLGFHERSQVSYCLLHHSGRLHHLRQKHLAGAKQIAHHAHAVHQRTFNHQQRPPQLHARFLGVRLDVHVNPLHQRMRKPLLHRAVTPFLGLLFFHFLSGARSLEQFAVSHQPLRRIGAPIQQHVLHQHLELRLNLFVHLQHSGVHNAHVHARRNCVIKKRGVHSLSNLVVASKAERDVRYAATDLCVRQVGLDPARCVDKVNRVVVVLLHAGCDSQNIRIEDDVLGRKPNFVHQNSVSPLADTCPVLKRRGLALFVECHHHRGGAILHHCRRVLAKLLFAFFQRDGIHNALALQALQPRLNHFPL